MGFMDDTLPQSMHQVVMVWTFFLQNFCFLSFSFQKMCLIPIVDEFRGCPGNFRCLLGGKCQSSVDARGRDGSGGNQWGCHEESIKKKENLRPLARGGVRGAIVSKMVHNFGHVLQIINL